MVMGAWFTDWRQIYPNRRKSKFFAMRIPETARRGPEIKGTQKKESAVRALYSREKKKRMLGWRSVKATTCEDLNGG